MSCEHVYSREAGIGLGLGETGRRNFVVDPEQARGIAAAAGFFVAWGAVISKQIYNECLKNKPPFPQSGKRQRTPKVQSGNAEIPAGNRQIPQTQFL